MNNIPDRNPEPEEDDFYAMPTAGVIERQLQNVCPGTRLATEGIDRFRVFTPHMLNDGDHLSIILSLSKDMQWVFSDEGHTHMRIDNMSKEMQHVVIGNGFGDALLAFVDALHKVSEGRPTETNGVF